MNGEPHKGKIYYGMHFQPGIASYEYKSRGRERSGVAYINEEVAKSMDESFPGCPVFVGHQMATTEEEFRKNGDGVVTESFFNPNDGNHWVKFAVTSKKGIEAIEKGWKLSNAYIPRLTDDNGGVYHGLKYNEKVIKATYDHLAIVENPRYEESVILTPDEFKLYNEKKKEELLRIANSKRKILFYKKKSNIIRGNKFSFKRQNTERFHVIQQ